MSRSLLRLLFLIPVVAGVLVVFSVFGDRSLPLPAQEYLRWYASQPLEGVPLITYRMSSVGLIGMAASTVGLLFFWSPARYAYLISVLLVLPEQVVVLPVLITGWENFLDNVAQITVGLNLGLMFSLPGNAYFASKQSAT